MDKGFSGKWCWTEPLRREMVNIPQILVGSPSFPHLLAIGLEATWLHLDNEVKIEVTFVTSKPVHFEANVFPLFLWPGSCMRHSYDLEATHTPKSLLGWELQGTPASGHDVSKKYIFAMLSHWDFELYLLQKRNLALSWSWGCWRKDAAVLLTGKPCRERRDWFLFQKSTQEGYLTNWSKLQRQVKCKYSEAR